MDIEDLIKRIAVVVEVCSATILLYGFVKVFLKFWLVEIKGIAPTIFPGNTITLLKPEIGGYILLGLDFYIISDILNSMVAQDVQGLIRLAGVVILRTLIGYFLGKEIEGMKKHTPY